MSPARRQVRVTEDIISGYKKKGTPKAGESPFELYAKKGELCNVIADAGNVLILERVRDLYRFPCGTHKTKDN